jgi:hypothetical protein
LGQAQITGDATLSEGAGVTLTQVAQDIEIALSGVAPPANWLPPVDCTWSLGEDVTPLRWNGLYSCGLVHIENRANLNALVIGDVDEEGGDIIVYENAVGNIAFQVDADAAALTLGNTVTWLGNLTVNSNLADSIKAYYDDGVSVQSTSYLTALSSLLGIGAALGLRWNDLPYGGALDSTWELVNINDILYFFTNTFGTVLTLDILNATFTLNLVPSADAAYSLGIIGQEWLDLRVTGNAYVDNFAEVVVIGGNGELANVNALVLGAINREGGDIVVYKTATNNVGFKVDADAGSCAVGGLTSAAETLKVYRSAATGIGLNIDGWVGAFDGVSANYLFYCLSQTVTTTTDTGFATEGLDFLVRNRRRFQNALPGQTMTVIGCKGRVEDWGGWTQTAPPASATRLLQGIVGQSTFGGGLGYGLDETTVDNTQNTDAIKATVIHYGTVNKTAGTLTNNIYGINSSISHTPVMTAGNCISNVLGISSVITVDPSGAGVANFTTTIYGAFIDVNATTEGTSIAYGVYVSALGADINWSGYFIDSPVGIGVDGSLANLTALQIGDTAQEGGDILVYNPAGTDPSGITFQVDTDLPAVKLPYWTGDYGIAWAGLALPAAPNGSLHIVYNSNAGVLASRLYVRSNGAWTYATLT